LRRRARIPADVADWLGDEGSLTRRLVRHCGASFRVQVVNQGWTRPLAGERMLLEMRGASALVREVRLHCGEEAWVFARTLIPASSLQGSARRLAQLGDKPLGAVLFADPSVRRGGTEVAKLLPHHVLFRSAAAHLADPPGHLWARRTLFFLAARPLLVNEVFLPDLPIYTSGQ
jgi:chorismate--pyruvate lyase